MEEVFGLRWVRALFFAGKGIGFVLAKLYSVRNILRCRYSIKAGVEHA